ncbi:MAG: toprim domain-containing protein, partial [Candidatus Poribacteria bacterium]|nr:toprim domain-containing protein [Candidatus Poribacteria bacterium]
MKVVLAEKPSVARDIARVIEAKTRHDGYFEGNGYQVTWSFGHLFSLQEPVAYDSSFKRWSLSTLPIIPDQFQLTLIQNDGVAKQFNTIKKLLRQAKDIICATDA